jgi:hypothetical protein
MYDSDDSAKVKAREYQIYKEACDLGIHYNKKLRIADLRVGRNLLSYMNCDTYDCFPGAGTLAEPLPMHERTTKRSLKALADYGHFRRSRSWDKENRRWKSSRYLPLIPDCVMPALEIRFQKQPDVLEIIKAVRSRLIGSNSSGVDLSLGGSGVDLSLSAKNGKGVNDRGFVTRVVARDCHEGSGVEMAQEPLTEPPSEPPSYTGRDEVITPSGSEEREEKRLSEEVRQESEEPLCSPDSLSSLAPSLPPDDRSGRLSYDELRLKYGEW